MAVGREALTQRSRGVRRIAFVARPFSAPAVPARVAGAREALFAAGLEPSKDFYRIGDPRDAAFVQELTAGRKTTASFAPMISPQLS